MRLTKLLRLIERKTGATANIQTVHPIFLAAERLRLDPDQYVHSGDVCRRMKLGGNFKTCEANKRRSMMIAEKGRPFHGVCPNGLWELAWPVMREGKLAAALYLGHFRPEESGKGDKIAQSAPRVDAKKKAALRDWAAFAARFMEAELEIIELEQPGILKRRSEPDLREQCLSFISQRYAENVALQDLAGLLNVNPNYLSGFIHRATGKTFRMLLNEKRVREAETYLRLHKTLSVTEIAGLCGFRDGNYFSTVFKKLTGMTPREYREK